MSGFLIGPCGVAPAVVVGAGGPTLSFIGSNTFNPVSGSTQTIASVSIGTASATRRVIIALLESTSYNLVTAISIGGVSCPSLSIIKNTTASYDGQIVFGYADVPTGTTATVVITGGSTLGDEGTDAFYIYTVDNSTLVNPSPTFGSNAIPSTSTTTTNTATVSTSANGFVIAALTLPGFGSATAQSLTASTETYGTADGSTSAGQSKTVIYSAKSAASANASNSATFSWTNATASVAALFAWS